MTPPPSARYVTTHNSSGLAVFSDAISSTAPVSETKFTKMELLYATPSAPVELSGDADIRFYKHHAENPPGPRIPGGSGVILASVRPGADIPLHRTDTIDVVVVMEGVLEAGLDSGEVRTLKPGDSIVQRGTKHTWKNVTPEDGWVRATIVTYDALLEHQGTTGDPKGQKMDEARL